MQGVESSWVAAIGYDGEREDVYVELIDGSRYVYMRVPPWVWRDFTDAASKGTFVNEVLKPGYRFRKG